jgi:hypothetical protein
MLDLLLRGQSDPLAEARARAREGGDREALARIEAVEQDQGRAEAEVLRRERETERVRTSPGVTRARLREALDAESKARRGLLDAMSRAHHLVRDALPATNALPPERIQALLAPGEQLLAYSVSSAGSCAFLVSPESIRCFEIPTQEVVEAADAYREAMARSAGDLDATVVPMSMRLFEAAVPRKMWASLSGAKRLYLLLDGALAGVPFETLVVAERQGTPLWWAEAGPPIAYEPSASVLAWLRARPRGTANRPDLVAVGNPVFAGNGPSAPWPETGALVTEVRAGGQAERIGLRPGDVIVGYDEQEVRDAVGLRVAVQGVGADRGEVPVRFVREGERTEVRAGPGSLGVAIAKEPPTVAGPALLAAGPLSVALRSALRKAEGLTALPGTGVEVEAIERLLRERKGDAASATVLLGPRAREAALHAAAQGPRFLHLATHGLVDETETASFSALALTMPTVPVVGDDGFLTLVDLFRRWRGRLEGTDLVVLSACESTRGREQRGEGIYALPWGFLFAGARAVVASHWKVSDESTALLMTELYRRILEEGEDPLVALAGARLVTKARHPNPYDWGAFVLIGAPD